MLLWLMNLGFAGSGAGTVTTTIFMQKSLIRIGTKNGSRQVQC